MKERRVYLNNAVADKEAFKTRLVEFASSII
jgi:hypothetical protein